MWLKNKRIRGISITHPLADSSMRKGLSDEEQLLISLELKRGNKQSVDRLINAYSRLIMNIVSQYAAVGFGNHVDDLVSIAFLAAIEACDEVTKGKLKDDNIIGYMITRIHTKMHNSTFTFNVINLPNTTMRRKFKKGDKLKPLVIARLSDAIRDDKVSTNLVEIRDTLDAAITTPLERDIVKYREQRYTYAEVAEKLGYSTGHIQQTMMRIQQRYEQMENCND
jgi:RNA polymerase sigma factor (sigma-70 family)